MYEWDEDDLDLFAGQEVQRPVIAHGEVTQDDKRDLNPWTLAKMNAPIRPQEWVLDHQIPTLSRGRSLSPLRSQASSVRCDDSVGALSRRGHRPLSPLPWQAPVPPSHMISGVQGRLPTFTPQASSQQLQIARQQLPTPLPSSSPTYGSRRSANQAWALRVDPSILKNPTNRPFVQPMRDRDRDRTEIGSSPRPTPTKNESSCCAKAR